jgi:phosphoribosylanthranilate isomerase
MSTVTPLRIKICGLTDPAEAAACAALGAWAIGVVFVPDTPRYVTVEQAARVVAAVPDGVRRVGLFVDAQPDRIAEAVQQCGLTDVQLHGADVDVAATRAAAGCGVIQAFAVDGPGALNAARRSEADLVLLDAAVPGRHGGTGRRFDWSLLETEDIGRPFVLAGGLDSGNVAEAVRRVRPAVVDVSSGVESRPGRKDPARVQAFIAAALSASPVGGRA